MEDVFLHTENSSFLVSKPGTDLLYAVSEMKEQAAVTTCRADAEGRLSFLRRVSYEGSALCQLSILPGSLLLGACYESGGVFYASLDRQGIRRIRRTRS